MATTMTVVTMGGVDDSRTYVLAYIPTDRTVVIDRQCVENCDVGNAKTCTVLWRNGLLNEKMEPVQQIHRWTYGIFYCKQLFKLEIYTVELHNAGLSLTQQPPNNVYAVLLSFIELIWF